VRSLTSKNKFPELQFNSMVGSKM